MHGRRGLIQAAVGFICWLMVGAIFYYLVENCSTVPVMDDDGNVSDQVICPWTFAQAFYFSVQTGLSIGFGLLAESQKLSEVYSIIHIMIGSSVISGVLALFATLALVRGSSFQSDEEKAIARHAHSLHAKDGYSGFAMSEMHDMMCTYPHHANAIIRKLDKDPAVAAERIKQFKEADENKRREMSSTILREAKEKLPEFQDEKLTVGELEEMEAKYASFTYRMKMKFREHQNFLVCKFAFFAWVAMGTIWSVTADENSFITGLYFSISTLSTAGMVSVKTVASQAHVLFVAFFALIGVPLYCTFLGMFANILVDRYNQRQVQDTLAAKFSRAEVEFLDHIKDQNHDKDVDLAEFIEIQILRLGLADRNLLKDIKNQFKSMDPENKGKVSKELFLHKMANEKANSS